MPQGKPDMRQVLHYPKISDLVAVNGFKPMLTVIYLLILDFCKSQNVTRNMSDEQAIEAAGMLLDQCGDYRLQDYVIMFTMAKRGLFDLKLYEGLDITKISMIEQAYDEYSSKELKHISDKAWEDLEDKGRNLREEQAKKFCQEYGFDYEMSKDNLFQEVSQHRVSEMLKAFGEDWQRQLMQERDKGYQERREKIEETAEAMDAQQERILKAYCVREGIDYNEAVRDWGIVRKRAEEQRKQIITDHRNKKDAA